MKTYKAEIVFDSKHSVASLEAGLKYSWSELDCDFGGYVHINRIGKIHIINIFELPDGSLSVDERKQITEDDIFVQRKKAETDALREANRVKAIAEAGNLTRTLLSNNYQLRSYYRESSIEIDVLTNDRQKLSNQILNNVGTGWKWYDKNEKEFDSTDVCAVNWQW